MTVIAYDNLPDGLSTALTYGLSLADHPDWTRGRAELCLTVDSGDDAWAWALGYLAEGLRGSCPFNYGDTISFGAPVSPQSALSGFVVFAPAVLDRADCRIDVSPPGDEGHDIIYLKGMYPVHEVERRLIADHGLRAFWDRDWDPFDVTRPPAV